MRVARIIAWMFSLLVFALVGKADFVFVDDKPVEVVEGALEVVPLTNGEYRVTKFVASDEWHNLLDCPLGRRFLREDIDKLYPKGAGRTAGEGEGEESRVHGKQKW